MVFRSRSYLLCQCVWGYSLLSPLSDLVYYVLWGSWFTWTWVCAGWQIWIYMYCCNTDIWLNDHYLLKIFSIGFFVRNQVSISMWIYFLFDSTWEINLVVPQKTGNRSTSSSSYTSPGHNSKEAPPCHEDNCSTMFIMSSKDTFSAFY